MRQWVVLLSTVALAMTVAVSGAVACTKPGPAPVLPQGATATQDEMKAGRDAVQSYVGLLQDYQACLEQQIKDAPPDTKAEDKQAWRSDANGAVDSAHALAAGYSAEMKAFKARQ